MDFNSLMNAADDILISTFNAGSGDLKGVTLWPGEGREINIEAVFDNPYSRIEIPDGGEIKSSIPSFTAHDRDVINLLRTNKVKVAEEEWVVKDLQPDGTGLTTVYLSKYKKSANDIPGSKL